MNLKSIKNIILEMKKEAIWFNPELFLNMFIC